MDEGRKWLPPRWVALLAALSAMGVGACADHSVRDGASADDGIGVSDTGTLSRTCPDQGAALQVLGSGGPIAEGNRAGTSYLLWIDGTPRLLIDAGAGSFLRFGQAGGNIQDLDAILLTHLHADHAGDLAGILNTGGFEGRSDPLTVIGPGGAPRFPSTSEFLSRLLGKEVGAFAYNGGYIDGSENKPLLTPRDIPSFEGEGEVVEIEVADELSITAVPVHHGVVPALGYAIRHGEKVVVITGDQSAFSATFDTALADSKPDYLFAHHVINGEPGQPRGLHRTPEQIGDLAAAIEPQMLVLTHNMNRSLEYLDEGLAAIADNYAGQVSVAADLDCYPL